MVVREKFETKAIPKSAKLIGIYFQIFSFYYEANTALREYKEKRLTKRKRQRSRQDVFFKEGVFRSFPKSTGKYFLPKPFFNIVTGLRQRASAPSPFSGESFFFHVKVE